MRRAAAGIAGRARTEIEEGTRARTPGWELLTLVCPASSGFHRASRHGRDRRDRRDRRALGAESKKQKKQPSSGRRAAAEEESSGAEQKSRRRRRSSRGKGRIGTSAVNYVIGRASRPATATAEKCRLQRQTDRLQDCRRRNDGERSIYDGFLLATARVLYLSIELVGPLLGLPAGLLLGSSCWGPLELACIFPARFHRPGDEGEGGGRRRRGEDGARRADGLDCGRDARDALRDALRDDGVSLGCFLLSFFSFLFFSFIVAFSSSLMGFPGALSHPPRPDMT